MLIKLKNEDTLIIDKFKLKCCVGKKGVSKNKFEGDFQTPSGKFNLGNLYWRSDRVKKPETNLICKKIKLPLVTVNYVYMKKKNILQLHLGIFNVV